MNQPLSRLEKRSTDALHWRLRRGNRARFSLEGPDSGAALSATEREEHLREEHRFIEELRALVAGDAAAAPAEPDAFVAWFEGLKQDGPGQGDPLHPFLAAEADREELRWFIAQEMAGEAGFADILALSQVGMPPEIKLGFARNYWDEMGCGREKGMHDPMLRPLAEALELVGGEAITPLEEAMAIGNLMVGLAWNRPYVWHAVGCLGAVELTAPGRCVHVTAGLDRIGLPAEAVRYYRLHAHVDVRHSEEWDRDVLRPAVAGDPRRARWIAEGALMRLLVGARSYAAYRRHLERHRQAA